MNSRRRLSSPREPAVVAKWLLIAFAIGLLAVEGAIAVPALKAGEHEAIFGSLLLLPWMVAPAAVAALLVARAKSRGEAWFFVGAEVAAIASTVWLWILTVFIHTGHANSEYAVGVFLLPLVQFAALVVYTLGVIATADLVLARGRQDKPRKVLLTVLTIASAVVLIWLGWLFGFIRI